MEVTRELVRAVFQKGHAATTILFAQTWLREHPNDIRVLLDYAEMLYELTRYADAIRVYEDILKNLPDQHWVVFNQLGNLHKYRGQLAEAEGWYRQAIATDPDELASYVLLGACQARQGKLQEAEVTYRMAIQVQESFLKDEVYHNLGLVLRGQNRLGEAADYFQKAIELTPDYEEAIEALADVQLAAALLRDGDIVL